MRRWTVLFDRETLEKVDIQETEGDICGIVCEPALIYVHLATREEAEAFDLKAIAKGPERKPEPEVMAEPEPEVMAEAEPEVVAEVEPME
jgi:hypothetical protein